LISSLYIVGGYMLLKRAWFDRRMCYSLSKQFHQ